MPRFDGRGYEDRGLEDRRKRLPDIARSKFKWVEFAHRRGMPSEEIARIIKLPLHIVEKVRLLVWHNEGDRKEIRIQILNCLTAKEALEKK